MNQVFAVRPAACHLVMCRSVVQGHVVFSRQGSVPQTDGANCGGDQTESYQGRAPFLHQFYRRGGDFSEPSVEQSDDDPGVKDTSGSLSPSCLLTFPDGEEEAGEQDEERPAERRVPGAAR